MLLALFVRQPWSAHQKYKVFGELKSDIFRYGTGASHIRLSQLLLRECEIALKACKHERVRAYGLTKFIVLYLVGEILRQESQGRALLDDPQPFLRQLVGGKNADLETQLLQGIGGLAAHVVTELNYFVEDHGGEAYDYKSEFKSPKSVEAIRSEVLKSYEKDKYRNRIDEFSLPVPNRGSARRKKK
jgi:hypothetical protein